MDFTSAVHALLGGLLIGAAVATLLLANGRVAGISGMRRRPARVSAGAFPAPPVH